MKKTSILCLLAVISAQNCFVTPIFAAASVPVSVTGSVVVPISQKLPKPPQSKKITKPVKENPNVIVPKTIPAPTAYREVTLIATAYYSPLPNQKYYLRSSHQAEVILNGNGTNGASGKAVFKGMLAAPKGYNFGTKIWIEGFGVGSVEDRGGAIVPAGARGNEHDRIDIWMGYGEEWLARALAWGRRSVKARIYESKEVAVTFDYSKIPLANLSKSIAKAAPTQSTSLTVKKEEKNTSQIASEVNKIDESDELEKKMQAFAVEKTRIQKIIDTLGTPELGDVWPRIRMLQEILIELGYLEAKSTAIYGPATQSAIAKFQKSSGLIIQMDDPNAGILGKLTRWKLVEEILYQGVEV